MAACDVFGISHIEADLKGAESAMSKRRTEAMTPFGWPEVPKLAGRLRLFLRASEHFFERGVKGFVSRPQAGESFSAFHLSRFNC